MAIVVLAGLIALLFILGTIWYLERGPGRNK